jgi:hypothetical protein
MDRTDYCSYPLRINVLYGTEVKEVQAGQHHLALGEIW